MIYVIFVFCSKNIVELHIWEPKDSKDTFYEVELRDERLCLFLITCCQLLRIDSYYLQYFLGIAPYSSTCNMYRKCQANLLFFDHCVV